MKIPTLAQISFIRQVNRELFQYMKYPLKQGVRGFLKRDAARYAIVSQFPDFPFDIQ
jgi:hypothetical protein